MHARRWKARGRRLVVGGAAVVAVAGLAGCIGPPSKVTFDVRVRCRFHDVFGPGPDQGVHTLHVSLIAPEWASPGETVPLSHMTITGHPVGEPTDLELARVTAQGIAPFTTSNVPPEVVLQNVFVGRSAPPRTAVDLGSASAKLTAAPGSYATLNLSSVEFVRQPITDRTEVSVCTPLSGQPTRLAAIEIRGEPVA